jgi:CDP-paratose synthetase
MKILLTGGSGFLGRALLDSFLAMGFNVILCGRQPFEIASLNKSGSVCEFYGIGADDLLNVFQIHPDIDLIIHAATDYGHSASIPTVVFRGNVQFPLRLLENAIAASIPLFINIDTFFNTGNTNYQYLGEYAMSKRHFQEWGELCGRREKIRFINLRFFHLYGPGDGTKKFVSSMIRDCLYNLPIDLTGGMQRRDFIFIKDAVSAVASIIAAESNKPAGYTHYDVGSGASYSIRDFVEAVKRLSNSSSMLNFGALPNRTGEFADACANIKALMEIGWSPSTSIEEGLRETIASYRHSVVRGD